MQSQNRSLGLHLLLLLIIVNLTQGRPAESSEEESTEESVKCLPSEMLTVRKGCVDRESHLSNLLQQVWADENLDDAKQKAGLKEAVNCKPDEILTVSGCAAKPKSMSRSSNLRAPVIPSQLINGRILKSDTNPANFADDTAVETRVSKAPSSGRKIRRPHLEPQAPIHGKDRPRKYVFLPGRKLYGSEHCRFYEVMGRNRRCLRKRGRRGQYKYKSPNGEYRK